jgi:ActR/RegA family two-component response regulator
VRDIRPLDDVIDEHIMRAMQAAEFNVSVAAEALGMHRRSLQRYLRRREKKQAAAARAARRKAG